MKKIISIAVAAATVLSMAFSAVNTYAAETLTEQNINYTELVGRVNQNDSGFTITSGGSYTDSNSMSSSTAALTGRNASGFQFYYLNLCRWSSNNGGADGPIDSWYLKWLDSSLANLRKNGGSCMFRFCYDVNGEKNPEPSSFAVLQNHQNQLAAILTKYSDVVLMVECGMAGSYGEMNSGRYSDESYKYQILDKWINTLPENITVNVRTMDEYIYYLNHSSVYANKYKNKTVNGIAYPETVTIDNCHTLTFSNEPFNRIGIYNDAMIQDRNDGGTFYTARENYVQLLHDKSDRTSYGGEFSGDAGIYRAERRYWMPLWAIPEFYKTHLSYYHGGNVAYGGYGEYKTGGTYTHKFDTTEDAQKQLNYFNDICTQYGSGMTHSASCSGTKVTYTYGGWKTATVDDNFISTLRSESNVTADLSAYKNQRVSTFFEDHLGYKLVIKKSLLSSSVKKGGKMTVKGTIDNTGFTNITRNKVVEIVLSDNANGDNMYTLRTKIDPRNWVGGTTNNYELTMSLPSDIKTGSYQVYMRVADLDNQGNTNLASSVRFANPGSYANSVMASDYNVTGSTVNLIYNPTVFGNYIGSVTVS